MASVVDVISSMIALLAFLAVLARGSEAKAQLPGPVEPGIAKTDGKALSDIRDIAKMFDDDAVAEARKALRQIEHETTVSTVIETVESLKGGSVEKTAERLARQSGIQGIFILIAKKEHKVEVLESRKFQSALTRSRREAVTDAFIKEFRRQKFDEGLKSGVAAIETVLADASKTGDLPKAVPAARTFGLVPAATPPAPFTATLVVRDRVRLTLAGARTILAGAEAKAASMQLKINVAVVDDGGHLLAFERIDGARPASAYTAITKATSAATFRQPTGPQPPGASAPDLHLSLSLQNAAEASGGKITTLSGGVPIIVDDQVIGGVGVGGGTGEQDAQIARAGVQSLLDELAAKPKESTEKGQ